MSVRLQMNYPLRLGAVYVRAYSTNNSQLVEHVNLH